MRLLFLIVFVFATLPVQAQTPVSIAEARALPTGTRVTVAGFVTVAAEFGGPVYLQDSTAGLAVYHVPLHGAVALGDSVVVTGPLTEFGATSGQPGTGLFQISGTGTTYQVFKNVNRPQTPRLVTIADIGEGIEGQLVVLRGVDIREKPAFTQQNRCPTNVPFTGAFAQGESYCLTDDTGYTVLYIDNTTNLVGASAPAGKADVVGVVGQFRGTHQVQPRSTADLGVQAFVIPGEEVPRDQTFEIGTWNLEWFGDPNRDPADDALALQNAATVISTIQPDVFGLQEIASITQFRALVDALPGYRGFVAPISQSQKTAFIYNTATVDSIDARFYLTSGDWASGRYPYAFTFDATIAGKTERITALVLHAKAFGDAPSYARRVEDANQLKAALDTRNPDDKVIVVGDFNDDIDLSTYQNSTSPYAAFVEDSTRYRFLTASLSARGAQSTSSGDMIDHILATDEVVPLWFQGTERVENPSYIGSYLSTTSDHFPVWVRLDFGQTTPVARDETLAGTRLSAPAPSPTTGPITFSYHLDAATVVRLELFDVLGRRVALLHDAHAAAGASTFRFDASALPAGVYLVRMTTASSADTRLFIRL